MLHKFNLGITGKNQVIIKVEKLRNICYLKVTYQELLELFNRKFFDYIYILTATLSNTPYFAQIIKIEESKKKEMFLIQYLESKLFGGMVIELHSNPTPLSCNMFKKSNEFKKSQSFKWFLIQCVKDKSLDKKYTVSSKNKLYENCSPEKVCSLYKKNKNIIVKNFIWYDVTDILKEYNGTGIFLLSRLYIEKIINSDVFLTGLYQQAFDLSILKDGKRLLVPLEISWFFQLYYGNRYEILCRVPYKKTFKDYNILEFKTMKQFIRKVYQCPLYLYLKEKDCIPIVINNNIPFLKKVKNK